MRRQRKAKIVATLGPASSTKEMILALFEAGVDVFRFNFSHGTQEDHRRRHEIVREVERLVGRPIAILADLQGPKLRIGTFDSGQVKISSGSEFVFDRNPLPGNEKRVCLPHPELFGIMEPGHGISLDDGKIRMKVIKSTDHEIYTRVENGGILSDRKGLNVPDVVLPIPALTEKDLRDLEFALALGVDWVALSFVQSPQDLIHARKIIAGRALLMTKLEKPSAMEHLDVIVRDSDAVMVARGDLGVELPPEKVPGSQIRIIRSCRQQGKPTIVATQMLESMISTPIPTRAEASDVATAIYEGADAVMLSAESASGAYPLQAVAMMNRIIVEVESDPLYSQMINAQQEIHQEIDSDAICLAMRSVSKGINAVVNVTYTETGATSLRTARGRPDAPILSITPYLQTARRLALAWGIHSTVLDHDIHDVNDMVTAACRVAYEEGLAKSGDSLTIVGGMPFGSCGTTNLLRTAIMPSLSNASCLKAADSY